MGFDSWTVCYGEEAERVYEILHEVYEQNSEYKNLSEAYEELREAHELLAVERDNLLLAARVIQ